MARTKPSAADTALIDHLRSLDLAVSWAQLERWRSAGVLPANTRRYLGRGKGSTSQYSQASLEIAEAMAHATKKGRSINEAILRIFTVNPSHNDLFEAGLKIPEPAIRAALAWFVEIGDQSLDRRIERKIQREVPTADEAAEIARKMTASHYRALIKYPSGIPEHRPPWAPPNARLLGAMEDYRAAVFSGEANPGSDVLADILCAFPVDAVSQADRDRLAFTLRSRELTGNAPPALVTPLTPEQKLERITEVDINRICDVRDKLVCVSEMGNLYLRTRGSEIAAELTSRMLDATTATLDAFDLFYAALPIAVNIDRDAWHRMTSLIVMILVDPEESLLRALDSLALAALPNRFGPDKVS
ncbi:hypothetical protein ACI2LC_11165 [Nonomuraea wenchangensis]|uniref:hypothetical protein n=1 Tax=Nonomuraea wenchangensis TaxID=568860 RepID=UPI003850F1E5